MVTSRKKSATSAPPVVRFFLAEDFRQEIGGKVSAIGMYPDSVVVLQLPPDVPDPTVDAPMGIRSLAFLFSVSRLTKSSTFSVDLESNGDRKPFMASRKFPATEPGNSVNLLSVVSPCLITSFGTKMAIVDIAGVEHTFEFEFRRVPMPEPDAQPKSEVKSLPAGSRHDKRKVPTAKVGR